MFQNTFLGFRNVLALLTDSNLKANVAGLGHNPGAGGNEPHLGNRTKPSLHRSELQIVFTCASAGSLADASRQKLP